MIIDFHTHIFPKKIRENSTIHFDTESSFKLLYKPKNSKLAGVKELIDMMDEEKIDISVVFGFPWKNPDTFKHNNDYIMEAQSRYPDRLKGFGCFDVYNNEVAKETERCIQSELSGIGELAFYQSEIDDEALKKLIPVMDICIKNNLPVMIHTNEPIGHIYPGKTPITQKQIYNLVQKFPDNKIILAHWGGGIFFYNLMKKDVKKIFKNTYFDTAASPFLYKREIYKTAVNLAGADKILFGTDYPLLKPGRYFKEIKSSGLSKTEIDCICGENARKLLGLYK